MLKINLEIKKVQTLCDNSCRITADTPELSVEAMSELFGLQKEGICAAVLNGAKGGKVVEAMGVPNEGKTPSERLRSVLFVYWKQEGISTPFNAWYETYMEQLISKWKEKLN